MSRIEQGRSYIGESVVRPQTARLLAGRGVFTDDVIDSYIALKMNEVTRIRMTTHPVEFDMYYSL